MDYVTPAEQRRPGAPKLVSRPSGYLNAAMDDRRGTDDEAPNGSDVPSVDDSTIREVLREHPVELAVLFGSTVTGSVDPGSDVDVAIELGDDIDEPRSDVVMDILVDLSIALDRNDIDLSLVDDLKPRVGLAAFGHGKLLLGTEEHAAELRETFARRVVEQSPEALRRRLNEALDNVDRHLDAGAR